jgi:hypothetical protein
MKNPTRIQAQIALVNKEEFHLECPMDIFILTLTLLFGFSCSHQQLIQEAHIQGSCSDEIKKIEPPPCQRLIDLSKQATSGSVSIAIAGIGAATDALVIVLTNPVTKFTLCVAAIAAVTASQSSHSTDLNICSSIAEPGYNPKLAQKALDGTVSWRCPNLDYISLGLREVASCYASHAETGKARQQLESILKNKTLSPCLSEEETEKIQSQISALK